MNKTKIDWPNLDYTWNPVTGCERGCEYCVVRNRVWHRIRHLYGDHDFNKLAFHPERMTIPRSIKKPSTFFCGFYTDIQFWKKFWFDVIKEEMGFCDWHTFMMLTKNPGSYTNTSSRNWPKNIMQGMTLEKCDSIEDNYKITLLVGNCPRPYLSIEPLLGNVYFNSSFQVMEKIIVGAMSGPGAVKPKKEWIQSVKDHVPAEKIYWKKNIKEYL